MLFLSCPPVYHLPGTWTECKTPLINHLNLSPDQGFILFIGLFLLTLVGVGVYNTFGSGKKDLRDPIDEHAKMHELGIAHGHSPKKS